MPMRHVRSSIYPPHFNVTLNHQTLNHYAVLRYNTEFIPLWAVTD